MAGTKGRATMFDRLVAAAMTIATATYLIPVSALAGVPSSAVAEIRGSVLQSDGLTAVTGVSVKAANMATRQIYTSAVTRQDGRYRLSNLPPGSYDLAVETPSGLFAADVLIDAAAGRRTIVSLSLRPAAHQSRQEDPPEPQDPNAPAEPPAEAPPEEPKPEEQPPAEPPQPEEQPKKRKGAGFWRSPTGAAIAIVVGAGLLGAAANSATGDDDEEEPMSPGGN